MKFSCILRAFACALVLSAAVRAQESKEKDSVLEEARQHVAAAKVHYDLGEFKEAADEYILVYRLRPIPALLFNIAQAYRQGGLYDKARQFYKSYLRESPNAPNKALIEQNIREMDELLAKERHTREAKPTGVTEPPDATLPIKTPPAKVADGAKPPEVKPADKPAEKPIEAARPPTPKPADTTASRPPGTQVAMTTPRPPAPSAAVGTHAAPAPAIEENDAIYTKWWFWTAVGVVAAGAGAAAMTMGGNAAPPSHFGVTGI